MFSINYFKSVAKFFFFSELLQRTVSLYCISDHSQVGDIQRSEAPDPSSKSFAEGIRIKSTRSQVTVAMLRYDSDFGLLYTYVCLNTTRLSSASSSFILLSSSIVKITLVIGGFFSWLLSVPGAYQTLP